MADATSDFVQVWIHQVLYQRHLYPEDAFELRNQYGVPVAMCIHPAVCKYISDFVTSIHPAIEKGTCRSISLVILTSWQQVLERHVCELDYAGAAPDASSTAALHHYFRGSILKLNTLASLLRHHASTSNTYRLGMELKPNTDSPIKNEPYSSYWVPGDPCQLASLPQSWKQLIPIKTIPTRPIKINLYVLDHEQTDSKTDSK